MISFRPLERDDFALLGRWLHAPHVVPWWPGDHSPAGLEAKYGPRIDGEVATEVFVIELDELPIGIIQRYRVADHDEWAAAVGIEDAAGIDYGIGEPELIGRGIGSRAIAAFSLAVFDRYPDLDRIVAAPQQANGRSCRALEKAGYELAFSGMLESGHPSEAGPSAVYVLERPLERAVPRRPRRAGSVALGRAMMGVGEIIEGKPEREYQEAEADQGSGDDSGLRFSFDPEDPTATSITIEPED